MRTYGMLLAAVMSAGAAWAQDSKVAITVDKAVIAEKVESREAVNPAEKFPATVASLVCWTEITPAEPPAKVVHVWFHNDKEVARVELDAKGPHWKTWSRKTILAAWTGAWKVEIQDAEGKVLQTVSFTVEAEPKAP